MISTLYGFISVVAILQVIYTPLILLHVHFNVVFYLTITLVLLVLVFLAMASKKGKLKKHRKKRKVKTKKDLILSIILGVIVLTQSLASTILFNENADDAFYTSLIEENKVSESIYKIDPATGDENTTFLSRYMVSGYELTVSVITKLFNIPATIFNHSILPFFMIILSYVAYYVFARNFFNEEKSKVFLIVLSILFLFSGFTTRFRGIILLSRMWQGKEIFLNIVLTLIISNLLSLNGKNQKVKLQKLTILNLAAVYFTNTAIFLVPFTYMGFAIIELINKNGKKVIRMLLTGIPIIIYGVIYLIVAQNVQGSTYTDVNVFDVIKDYFGNGFYGILYILSLIVIFLRGNKKAKTYFILIPIIYALTIYNPLLTKLITKFFTGSEVFWRLFWLLPVEFSIVYAFMLLLSMQKNEMSRKCTFIVELVLLIVAGKFVYTNENGFDMPQNANKIPQTIINHTQFILEKQKEGDIEPTVMAPEEPLHNATMRQLTSKIKLFWSRDHYMKEMYPDEEIQEREKIYAVERNQIPTISTTEFDKIRQKYQVDWIIVSKENSGITNYLDRTKRISRDEVDGYYLYQY